MRETTTVVSGGLSRGFGLHPQSCIALCMGIGLKKPGRSVSPQKIERGDSKKGAMSGVQLRTLFLDLCGDCVGVYGGTSGCTGLTTKPCKTPHSKRWILKQ